MKRAIKEAISGIGLVGSLIAIYFFILQLELKSFDVIYSIAILLLVAICLLSMVGLVIYSRTGSKVEGSKGEWAAAIAIDSSGLLFWNRGYKEQVRKDGNKGQKKK
jgi:hypothetical protein